MTRFSTVFSFCLALSIGIAALAQPGGDRKPEIETQSSGNTTNILSVTPDLREQSALLQRIRSAPPAENDRIVAWLKANTNALPPAFTYELGRRQLADDPTSALESMALGWIRARYDAARCVDRTAAGAVQMLIMSFPEFGATIQNDRAAHGAAGLRALERREAFDANASPWWACSTGMGAIRAGMENRRIEEADWLKPREEWAAIQADLRRNFKDYFEQQSKPQDDPIPMASPLPPHQTVKGQMVQAYAWLDAQTLVLGTHTGERGPSPRQRLQIWRMSKAEPEQTDIVTARWCAARDRLYFDVSETAQPDKSTVIRYRFGKLGADGEAELRTDRRRGAIHLLPDGSIQSSVARPELRQTPYDCEIVEDQRFSPNLSPSHWTPLLKGEGYLTIDYQKDRSAGVNLSYYSDEKAEPVLVATGLKEFNAQHIRYHAFARRYFVSPPLRSGSADRNGGCFPTYWFDARQKTLVEQCIPVDALNDSFITYSPFKNGMLRVVGERRTAHGPKEGGVYVTLPSGRSVKVLETRVKDHAVSPDGCRIAVGAHPVSYNGPRDISVVDLCASSLLSQR